VVGGGVGVALGLAGTLGIRLGKVRSPVLAGIAGFVGGCVAMLSIQFFDYLRVPVEARRAVGIHTFFGYVDFAAHQGVTIGRATSSSSTDKGMNLGYVGTYIYWIVELLLVAGIAFVIMKNGAGEPFCPEGQAWKQRRTLMTFRPPLDRVVVALEEGDLLRVMAEEEWTTVTGEGVLSASVCPECESRGLIDVKLEQVIQT